MDKFSPSRLQIARYSRALQVQELADHVGCSTKSITNYEHGLREPEYDTAVKLAGLLRYPLSYFFSESIEVLPDDAATFRSRRSMPAWLRHKAMAYGQNASACVSTAFRTRFRLPALDLPDMRGETSRTGDDNPSQAAVSLRAYWSLGEGPIDNMVHLLESRGVEVYWLDEGDMRVDAFSFWYDGVPYVILNSAKGAGDRARFNAAHELAHLVLHRDASGFDTRLIETEADRFAAEFLVPSDQFREESPSLPILGLYENLKARWKVSIQALIRRSFDIGALSEWHYKVAYMELSASGMRRNEPVPIEPESSRLHSRIFMKLQERGVSLEDFAAREAQLDRDDILQLCPVAWAFARSATAPEIGSPGRLFQFSRPKS